MLFYFLVSLWGNSFQDHMSGELLWNLLREFEHRKESENWIRTKYFYLLLSHIECCVQEGINRHKCLRNCTEKKYTMKEA